MRIVAGGWKGRQIKTGEGPGYRPAMAKTREAVFSMLEARLGGPGSLDGARVLDVFAGSGSLGIEALSRGAGFARFVELARPAARLIAENLKTLGAAPGSFRVETADALAFLKRPADAPYDVVFVDPPYGRDFAEKSLALVASGGYLAPGGVLLAEVEADRADPVPGMLAEFAPLLTVVADRRYGQTRIILWQMATDDIATNPAPETAGNR